MSKFQDYNGWELNFFDKANNFREYQWSFFRKHIKKKILEVGPGNCVFFEFGVDGRIGTSNHDTSWLAAFIIIFSIDLLYFLS